MEGWCLRPLSHMHFVWRLMIIRVQEIFLLPSSLQCSLNLVIIFLKLLSLNRGSFALTTNITAWTYLASSWAFFADWGYPFAACPGSSISMLSSSGRILKQEREWFSSLTNRLLRQLQTRSTDLSYRVWIQFTADSLWLQRSLDHVTRISVNYPNDIIAVLNNNLQ